MAYSESPWNFPSSCVFIFSFAPIRWNKKSSATEGSSSPIRQILNSVIVFPYSFWSFSSPLQIFFKRVIKYSNRAWSSLSPCVFVSYLAPMCWRKIRVTRRHTPWQAVRRNSFFCYLSCFLFQKLTIIEYFSLYQNL